MSSFFLVAVCFRISFSLPSSVCVLFFVFIFFVLTVSFCLRCDYASCSLHLFLFLSVFPFAMSFFNAQVMRNKAESIYSYGTAPANTNEIFQTYTLPWNGGGGNRISELFMHAAMMVILRYVFSWNISLLINAKIRTKKMEDEVEPYQFLKGFFLLAFYRSTFDVHFELIFMLAFGNRFSSDR